MNVEKLNESIEVLKKDLGEGLVSTDIWSVDTSLPIASYNSKPESCAVKNKITDTMYDSFKNINHPGIGRYYILDYADLTMEIVIPLGKYQWGIQVNPAKVALGLLLNIVVPRVIDSFEQAMVE
ncbi:MAG: hypothetical protein APR63_07255 [Desulfuromonas sp. SDB]|nr:MAG: hypothetical protein APR63_07255 [Desulfuromonas sp. SDB]